MGEKSSIARPTRAELASKVDEAEWRLLKIHLVRGGLIVIAPDLDIVDAGVSIASDDTETVTSWIAAGKIAKPAIDEISAWDASPASRFSVLIVSPYVLMKELPVHGAI